ncbi:MAG: two-component sensor histidine kinase [Cytophagaceae bacterium]|nr:two-component sensor histidine kinase [Cytophagaceae bacterium]|tara:strand:- start:1133 stop:2761 length:1629 start_codon:yes stop_codon:yes gene_type:complete
MKNRKYQYLVYFIAGVVLVTLAIQVYWNVKNYGAEKQRLVNDIQICLDQAVDNYYAGVARNSTIGLFQDESNKKPESFKILLDSLEGIMGKSSMVFNGLDSASIKSAPGILILRGKKSVDSFQQANYKNVKLNKTAITQDSTKLPDSLNTFQKGLMARLGHKQGQWDSIEATITRDSNFIEVSRRLHDSLYNDIQGRKKTFSSLIITSTTDFIDLKVIDSLFMLELDRKKLDVDHGLLLSMSEKENQIIHPNWVNEQNIRTSASSKLLPDQSMLDVYFTNITAIVLQRNLVGILLSLLLVCAVIACLLFLLKIINRQKQLAEVKNDLINNITHEFKTPIATIGVALEGMDSFNTANDPAKTKKYVQTSSMQLNKLNLMVEKLLETATLDSDTLSLNKEEINLVDLLQNLMERHKALAPEKHFEFFALRENIWVMADAFHLENALNNVLDNAVKYGGNTIKASINTDEKQAILTIEDNGKNLTSAQAKQIFEKFYRVPKGNQHDVKGFGIGLYYTQKIIEGHQGTITVELKDSTNFKITLPHG